MKKYDQLWQDLNNLLAILRSPPPNSIVEMVRTYYAQYGNDAPPQLLQAYIDKVQKHLDEATDSFREAAEAEDGMPISAR